MTGVRSEEGYRVQITRVRSDGGTDDRIRSDGGTDDWGQVRQRVQMTALGQTCY